MGFEDRQYFREDSVYGQGGLARYSIVVILIVINFIVWFLDAFTDSWLNSMLCLDSAQLWRVWTFLTYGFVHSPLVERNGAFHIIMNMFVLFMFGRIVSERLGRNEFLRFYLTAIVASGLVFAIWCVLTGQPARAVGASGATTAVLILFILWYPNQKLSIIVAEMPAWVFGVAIIALDLFRAFSGDSKIAWQAHLGGAAFAWAYFNFKWNFSWMSSLTGWIPKSKNSRNLSIYDPDPKPSKDEKLREEGDRILAKISEQGEESLSRKERKTLERYSKMLRQQK